MNINKLPEDCLRLILDWVIHGPSTGLVIDHIIKASDAVVFSLVCKRWKRIASRALENLKIACSIRGPRCIRVPTASLRKYTFNKEGFLALGGESPLQIIHDTITFQNELTVGYSNFVNEGNYTIEITKDRAFYIRPGYVFDETPERLFTRFRNDDDVISYLNEKKRSRWTLKITGVENEILVDCTGVNYTIEWFRSGTLISHRRMENGKKSMTLFYAENMPKMIVTPEGWVSTFSLNGGRYFPEILTVNGIILKADQIGQLQFCGQFNSGHLKKIELSSIALGKTIPIPYW